MSGESCRQAGCTGVIEDGYCNACGIAAAKSQTAATKGSAPGSTRSSSVATGTGSSPVSHGTRGSRPSTRSTTRSSRKSLGAGLVSVPELPSTDPEKAVMTEPKVPPNKRFCAGCDKPLSRETGFCGHCGQKYSFVPTLQPGDVLADQYEVKGAIAYGGLGWIYLAFDRVLSRYVVLKGLLNTEDTSAAAAAVAERQFLAAVKHPNIVGIYNFVQHGAEGFIVMEYVGGKTLRDIRRARGPLPVSEAIAYIHRILSAFAYLHQMQLVYCDFKPENVMLEGEDVKLIDLGGVRRIGDPKGDIYGTEGYSAPEAGEGPTVVSDLFTVGRSLAVLIAEIPGFRKEYRFTLPSAADESVFAKHESLFRLLLKATAGNPDDRFVSADEMADQLLGVLREVVALETGTPRPSTSTLFSGDMLAPVPGEGLQPVDADYRHLPTPVIDATDAGFNQVINATAIAEPERRIAALRAVTGQIPKSIEARLRLANALVDSGESEEADKVLKELETADPWDWRPRWYRGRLLLAQNKASEAQQVFDQVYFDLPGELAPKLAFAMAAEQAKHYEIAARMYDLVSRTNPDLTSACFGLARCMAALGDRNQAVAALGRVPQSCNMHVRARVETARALISRAQGQKGMAPTPSLAELTGASQTIEELSLEGMERYRLSQQVLESALELVTSKALAPSAAVKILGKPLREEELRQGLEESFRSMARLTSGAAKVQLVDEANRVRPRTLF